MMKRYWILAMIIFILGSSEQLNAQNDLNLLLQDELEEEFPERSGFVFGLNFGAYFANKASANFYNGSCAFQLTDNQAQCTTIEDRLYLGTTEQQVQNDLQIQSFTIPRDASPTNMRYNPGLLVGFRFGYRFNTANAIMVDVNYANLKAADKFTLVTNLAPDNGQGTEDIRVFNIIGEEDRLNIGLGYRTALVINETTNWYFGAGGHMTSVRLNENFLEIEGSTYNLWVNFVGPNTFNGPVGNLTATGLGWYGETGVEAFFNEKFEANLGVRRSRDRIRMGTLDDKMANWQVFFTVSI